MLWKIVVVKIDAERISAQKRSSLDCRSHTYNHSLIKKQKHAILVDIVCDMLFELLGLKKFCLNEILHIAGGIDELSH